MRRSRRISFEAPLTLITQNRCVVLPQSASTKLGACGRVAVKAAVLGEEFESTLVPAGSGRHRLFIPSSVWRTYGLAPGDLVPVTIWKTAPTPSDLPPDLARLSTGSNVLAEAYARVTPADRRQIAKYLDAAKSDETRRARAAAIAKKLLRR